ncbi:hypothetical protein HC031_10050 [Planosporangium thailandense]|uniref:DUF4386 family protein n=1 Tax=Planosporangium thailandense TaxID=765197 RepID=A0ABX0XVI1_9ACTN|nr:hypothetical protein [Planosporangium thailandense]NJC70048.1 hypothetical protein [Planosporangium thailandense]
MATSQFAVTATADTDTDTDTADVTTPAGTRTRGALRLLAGVALVAGPVLFAAGMATSPEAASASDADYIASLARDATQTQVSALFLHYANLLIGLGILAAPALVRGRRGFWPALIGAVLAAIGFANLSGTLLSDWWNLSAGTHLSSDQAVAVFHGFKQASLLGPWNATTPFNLIGPVLVLVGLARAGVVRWWTVPLLVAGVIGLMVIPPSLPQVTAAAVLVGFSPLALIGARLVGRYRAGTV